ncbi:MAG: WG repeat-containing protein [Candidatus Omnitrophica bacterium]|nr:WG repeat-containing protein [Candidatus Omnitrophota bacterium]
MKSTRKVHAYDRKRNAWLKKRFGYFAIGQFSEGLAWAAVTVKQGSRHRAAVGFIDRTGRIVIRPNFDITDDFSEGLAAVQIRGRWGFINKKGKLVVEPKFKEVDRFSQGLALVKIGRRYGYIDKAGHVAIRAQFTWADNFFKHKSKRWAFAGIGSKAGLIDESGNGILA